jgi:membrane-bound inhibitor of C-type lysozyme
MRLSRVLVLLATALLVACGGGSTEPGTTMAASQETASQGIKAALEARPGETVYRCADGRVAMAEFVEGMEEIGLRVGAVNAVLEPAPAASGSKYQGGDIVFWTRGDEARLETHGAAPTTCQRGA